MTEDEARHTERLLKLCGLPGVAAPVTGRSGEWRIYDGHDPRTRTDITAEAVRRLRAGVRSGRPVLGAAGGAVRGFVVPGAGSVV